MSTEAPASLHEAIHAVQAEATTLQKSAINPHFKSKYIPLDSLHEAVLPIVNQKGLTWTTRPGYTVMDGKVSPTLVYSLTHAASAEALTGEMLLLPVKQDPQAQGSAITYARRYALMAVLGLVADEDDDGNGATGAPQRRQAKPKPKAKAKPAEVKPDGAVTEGTLGKLREAARAVGYKAADLRPILDEAGAAGKAPGDLTEDQANWVIVKLRSLPVQAATTASE